jgi:hypothetical protein
MMWRQEVSEAGFSSTYPNSSPGEDALPIEVYEGIG